MAQLEVRIRPGSGSLYHMELYHEGTHIGDYEQSIEANIPRKREEIRRSADFLLDTYAKYGKFVVRWSQDRTKDVREYQEGGFNPGRPVVRLGVTVPKRYWDWA